MPNPGGNAASRILYQGPSIGWAPIPLTLSAQIIQVTTTTDVIPVGGSYSSAIAYLGVSSASGTLLTFIQALMPDGVTWIDYACFNATSTATSQVMGLVSAGNSVITGLSPNSLAVATVRSLPFADAWRVVFQIAAVPGIGVSSFTYTAAISFF